MTGLIYAAIAIAWLAYLVPWFLRKRAKEDEKSGVDPRIQLGGVKIIRDVDDTGEAVDADGTETKAEVSTPLMRRAQMHELRAADRAAAARRRHVLVFLVLATAAVTVAVVTGSIPWPVLFAPAGLLVGFVVLARFSVRAMRRKLDRQYQLILNRGNEEATTMIKREDAEKIAAVEPVADEASVPVSPVSAGNVWEPLPVTRPTYVSRPLAPRTVRTIDLSSPELTASLRRPNDQLPVTAEPIGEIAEDSCPIDLRPAAGA